MKRIAVLFIVFFILLSSAQAKTFSDIRESNPYFNATHYLSQFGVIDGYSDGSFKPYNDINRAELLKLLIEGAEVPLETPSSNCFPDTPYNQWYSPYICTAKTLGYVNGYPDGSFKPAQKINKVEALKMLGKIYTWDLPKTMNPLFTDTPSEEWYIPYLNYAKTKNLLPETGTQYKPDNNMTRGSISETLYRYLAIQDLKVDAFSEELEIEIPEESAESKVTTPKFQTTILAPGEINVTLSWNSPDPEIPADLDAHLIQPNQEEVYFTQKISSNVDSLLEAKDENEIISIRNYQDGTNEYFVNNFAGEDSFASSNAKVEIHDQNGLAAIFYPEEGEEKIWKVFELSKDRELTEFNKTGNCELIEGISVLCPVI